MTTNNQTEGAPTPRHGLCSNRPTLAVENKDEFDYFANDFIVFLNPVNPIEEFYSQRIASLAWRLRRSARYESLVLDHFCDTAGMGSKDRDKILGKVLADDFGKTGTLEKILRYETRIENSYLCITTRLQDLHQKSPMDYADIRRYVRGYEPRNPFFSDAQAPTPARQQKVRKALNLAQKEESKINNVDQASPLDNKVAASSFGSLSDNVHQPAQPDTASQTIDSSIPQIENLSPRDRQSSIENTDTISHDTASQTDDSTIVNNKSSIDNQQYSPNLFPLPLSHRPNPPQGKLIYRKNWAHKVLDLVHYPENNRPDSDADLRELADQVLCSVSDPRQFLWDFDLLENSAIENLQPLALAC
jgi:hypothetical protein